MVNPGGTGSPSFLISARLAPLPPRRSLCSLLPSLKRYTYLATPISVSAATASLTVPPDLGGHGSAPRGRDTHFYGLRRVGHPWDGATGRPPPAGRPGPAAAPPGRAGRPRAERRSAARRRRPRRGAAAPTGPGRR